MTYEVELKFRLDQPSGLDNVKPPMASAAIQGPGVRDIVSRLEGLGARRQSAVEQLDRYFNHPHRDFAQTDEALRLRVVGDECFLTYKGPLVDAQTKTRQEIEIPVGRSARDAGQFVELLAMLGFEEVRTVRKSRVPFHLLWEDRDIELALDKVEGLGTFLEIEAAADESQWNEVRNSLLRLAQKLGLENSIRKSYLALLLEEDRP